MTGAAIAIAWMLHATHWALALRRRGRSAAVSGEWSRELALRAFMLVLVIAAVLAPPVHSAHPAPWLGALLIALVFAGHSFAIAGRAALQDAWGIGTRPRSGAVVRHGPYRIVRHPIYTGVMVALAAQCLLLRNVPSFVLFGGGLVVMAMKVRAERQWLDRDEHEGSGRKHA